MVNNGYKVHLASPQRLHGITPVHIDGVIYHQVALNNPVAWKDFKDKLGSDPDYAFFDTFISEEYFSYLVTDSFPECVRILDTQDLHGIRFHREARYNAGTNEEEVLSSLPSEGPNAVVS